mmetsp:Transcript_22833/g.63396  ORF Transcript_22833/g.63396 Transcript_22833/m.63396 type:complete len:390 (-) Transcript_22833:278-1447(-)
MAFRAAMLIGLMPSSLGKRWVTSATKRRRASCAPSSLEEKAGSTISCCFCPFWTSSSCSWRSSMGYLLASRVSCFFRSRSAFSSAFFLSRSALSSSRFLTFSAFSASLATFFSSFSCLFSSSFMCRASCFLRSVSFALSAFAFCLAFSSAIFLSSASFLSCAFLLAASTRGLSLPEAGVAGTELPPAFFLGVFFSEVWAAAATAAVGAALAFLAGVAARASSAEGSSVAFLVVAFLALLVAEAFFERVEAFLGVPLAPFLALAGVALPTWAPPPAPDPLLRGFFTPLGVSCCGWVCLAEGEEGGGAPLSSAPFRFPSEVFSFFSCGCLAAAPPGPPTAATLVPAEPAGTPMIAAATAPLCRRSFASFSGALSKPNDSRLACCCCCCCCG